MEEITVNEAMLILRISRSTFQNWLKDGKIKPSRRAGRKLLFDKEYIDNFGKEGL